MNEPKTPPPPPAGQPPQQAVVAERRCFPYETHEPALAATAQTIADCLPATIPGAEQDVDELTGCADDQRYAGVTRQSVREAMPEATEVAAAVRLVELIHVKQAALCEHECGHRQIIAFNEMSQRQLLLFFENSTWNVVAAGRRGLSFPSLSLALAALTGDAAEETNP